MEAVLIEKLWAKAALPTHPDGCVEWTGAMHSEGYGMIGSRGYAHRVAYELLVGEIPKGFQIDHLCRNRACMNPNHLEAVTQQVNLRRGNGASAINARKTHCKWGHEYTEENTYRRPDGKGKMCRTCRSGEFRG